MLNKRLGLSVFLALSVVFLFQSSTDPQKPVASQAAAAAPQIQNLNQLPLYFIENSGQLDESIAYHLKMSGGNVHFAKDSICYQFVSSTQKQEPMLPPRPDENHTGTEPVSVETLRVSFEGASDNVETFGVSEHEARFNFYQGAEPESWVEGARSFNKVKYRNLYPLIDLMVFRNQGFLKQEYRVRPGGKVADICAVYEGVESLGVNKKGQLRIQTVSRTLLEDTPISYQVIAGRKINVDTEYILEEGNRVRFKVADFDPEHALVIDPSLLYSTFLGGLHEDYGVGIAIDLHLDAYIVGMTHTNFVSAAGSSIWRGYADIVIAKLDSTGSHLLFTSTFGGSREDVASGIVFSWGDKNPVIVGNTNSGDFPTTPGAYDRSLGGNMDIFIAKFSSTGELRSSTLFGGGDNEDKAAVAVDGAGNIYVSGNTESPNFPTTPGAIDEEFNTFDPKFKANENNNLFVAKFSKKVKNLLYSTLYGGPGIQPGGISVDFAGNAFITGTWSFLTDGSSWIPITPGAYSSYDEGGYGNAFVASLAPTGKKLNYSTYVGQVINSVGWENYIWTHGISVDGSGRAFITGNCVEEDFNYFHPGFVAGFNPSGTDRLFVRKFRKGAYEYTRGRGIAVDGRGSVYAVFHTEMSDLETSDDAFQQNKKGKHDLFITKLNASNGNVLYATYMGGSDDDFAGGLVVDSFGSAYITGKTWSFDFPTTAGAYSTLYGGNSDAFIARIRDSSPGGQLVLSRYKLVFSSRNSSLATLTKSFGVRNQGKGVVNYDVSTNQKWLTVDPISGDVRNEQDTINVSVTAGKLKAGTHEGIVKVSSVDAYNSPAQLVVKFKVKGPTFRIKRKKYTVSTNEGSTTPISLVNKIKNKGTGNLRYKLKAMDPWLSVMPKRGTSTGEWDEFTIEVDPAGIAAGIHQGIIQVISKDTVDSPVDITITLNIKAEE